MGLSGVLSRMGMRSAVAEVGKAWLLEASRESTVRVMAMVVEMEQLREEVVMVAVAADQKWAMRAMAGSAAMATTTVARVQEDTVAVGCLQELPDLLGRAVATSAAARRHRP